MRHATFTPHDQTITAKIHVVHMLICIFFDFFAFLLFKVTSRGNQPVFGRKGRRASIPAAASAAASAASAAAVAMSGTSASGSSAGACELGIGGADVCPVAAAVKVSADKPAIGDFSLGASLGEGNFSRIVRATHRATGEAFALKTIEKTRVKRLRIRHPNIFNEINMEKDVLNQLRHPNIIRLYHTFQVRGAGCRHVTLLVRLTTDPSVRCRTM